MKKFCGSLLQTKSLIGLLLAIMAVLPISVRAATVVGTVRSSADTSIHIQGAKVVLIAATVRVESTTTDSVGNYRLDSVAVGNTKSIQVTKTGFPVTTSGNFNVTAAQSGATITQNINMQIFGSISGTVRKASDSSAMANVLVQLTRGTSTTIVDSARTSSLGLYAFTNVSPGAPNYTVTISFAGYLGTTTTGVVVASGGSASANAFLAVAIPATINGTVRKLADTTFRLANAKVLLRRSSATSAVIDSAVSDSLGRYTFTNVAPGAPNYWISATLSGYIAAVNANVVIGNGLTVTSNIAMGSPGVITGTLTNAVTPDIIVPISGAKILLRRGNDTSAVIDSTVSNSQGRYTFNNVAPGTPNYWITAVTNIGNKTNANVVAASGGTVTSDFAFVQTVSLHSTLTPSQSLRFTQIGDNLVINLKAAQTAQTVEVYGPTGAIYSRVSIPAGETRATIPTFLLTKGFLLRVK